MSEKIPILQKNTKKRPFALIGMAVAAVSAVIVICVALSFETSHKIKAGKYVGEQYQLVPNALICGKVNYLSYGQMVKNAYCYVSETSQIVCYDNEKECMANTTWTTGTKSDNDKILLDSSLLTITGKVCTKNYWRKTPEARIQSLYCFTETSGIQCYDNQKECLVENNKITRLDQTNLKHITNVDNQVCTKNLYLKNGNIENTYCWSSTKGQQCWVDSEKCQADAELQVAGKVRKAVDLKSGGMFGLNKKKELVKQN